MTARPLLAILLTSLVLACQSKPHVSPAAKTEAEAEAVANAEANEPAVREDDLARFMPPGTLAFVALQDVIRTAAEFEDTAVAAVLREEKVAAFLAKPLAKLMEKMREVEEEEDFRFDDVRRAFSGQVAVGLVEMDIAGESGAVLLIAEVTDSDALDRLNAEYETKIQPLGEPGWEGFAEVDGEAEFMAARSDRFMAIAVGDTGKGAARRAIEGVMRPREESLAASETYLAAMSPLGGRRDLTMYVDVDAFTRAFMAAVSANNPEHEQTARAVVEALGLDGQGRLSWSLAARMEPPGIRTVSFLRAPEPRKGLMSMISGEPLSEGMTRLLPGNAIGFYAERTEMGRIGGIVRDVARAAGREEALDAGYASVMEMMGMDIEGEILGSLGGEAAIVLLPLENEADPDLDALEGLVLIVDIARPDVFGPLMERLLAMADVGLRMSGRGGLVMEEALGERSRLDLAELPIAPAIALVGDKLVLGGSARAAREIVRLARGEGQPYVGGERFKADFARLGPDGASGVSFENVQLSTERAVKMLRRAVADSTPEKRDEIAEWVDVSLIPPAGVYERHLFPQALVKKVTGEGLISESYGPSIGPDMAAMGVAGMAGVVAAIAIPNIVQSRMASNEVAAQAALRHYIAAQNQFRRADFYGTGRLVYANPGDGRGFPDLHTVGGEEIRLIDAAFAGATAPESARAGYWFADIVGGEGEDYDFAIECGLCAVPAQYGRTGRQTFIIDISGTVYQKDTGGQPVDRFPLDPAESGWLPVGF